MKQEIPQKKPFFYDVTLRDGNQALRRPWNLKEKEKVFNQLIKLGVQGIEVGFSGASDMDFKACDYLARIAPDNVVISGLARAVKSDIEKVWEAIKTSAQPRIHTFITTSPYNMENVLRMKPQKVLNKAVEAVTICRDLMGGKGDVQFSAEHFGDCRDNLDFVIEVVHAVIEAGAGVVNLPNTVERYRPAYLVDMVSKVTEAVRDAAMISVHNHNDLGMATATTVEAYFAGAVQLETTLNGLGERAGNTNMYEVAGVLFNCGVEVPLNMKEIYETAILTSELSRIPIPEKSPLIGSDVIAHRSGIHQDGAIKTKAKGKGAYRAMDLTMIGRKESDRFGFTSQSGKTAVFEIIEGAGLPITMEEASYLQPIMKRISEEKGELEPSEILEIYDREIMNVRGPLSFIDMETDHKRKEFLFKVVFKEEQKTITGKGTGPVEACYTALVSLGLSFHLLEYKQQAQDAEHDEAGAYALSELILKSGKENGSGTEIIARGKDMDTVKANIKAMFNGINLLFRAGAMIE